MRLDLSQHMTAAQHNGVTVVTMSHDGSDLVVLLCHDTRDVSPALAARCRDGYRVVQVHPMADHPTVTAFILARPARQAA